MVGRLCSAVKLNPRQKNPKDNTVKNKKIEVQTQPRDAKGKAAPIHLEEKLDPKKEDMEKIRKEVEASLKKARASDKPKEKESKEKEGSIDEKVRINTKSTTVSTAYRTGVKDDVYSVVFENPEDLYLYRSKEKGISYTPFNLGENGGEFTYKDLSEFVNETKAKKMGQQNGSGLYISVEKQERFKLHQMVCHNFSFMMVLYQNSMG